VLVASGHPREPTVISAEQKAIHSNAAFQSFIHFIVTALNYCEVGQRTHSFGSTMVGQTFILQFIRT
jgi:hypothetical protein